MRLLLSRPDEQRHACFLDGIGSECGELCGQPFSAGAARNCACNRAISGANNANQSTLEIYSGTCRGCLSRSNRGTTVEAPADIIPSHFA